MLNHMAAHELTFHLWEAGFNRNTLQGEKYYPAQLGGCVGWGGMPKPIGKLLQVLQLAQGWSL